MCAGGIEFAHYYVIPGTANQSIGGPTQVGHRKVRGGSCAHDGYIFGAIHRNQPATLNSASAEERQVNERTWPCGARIYLRDEKFRRTVGRPDPSGSFRKSRFGSCGAAHINFPGRIHGDARCRVASSAAEKRRIRTEREGSITNSALASCVPRRKPTEPSASST